MLTFKVISYLYGVYLIILAFDHYSDFTTVKAQLTEQDASQRLNQIMLAAFRRNSTSSQISIDSINADCESLEEQEVKSLDALNMMTITMTRRVSSIKGSY